MHKAQQAVKVRTTEGAFSTERAVSIQLADGSEVSLYADKELINKRAGQEFLKVVVVKEDTSQKTKTVLLPSETFETMTRWAEVRQDRVVQE